jgi:hypothetical protein
VVDDRRVEKRDVLRSQGIGDLHQFDYALEAAHALGALLGVAVSEEAMLVLVVAAHQDYVEALVTEATNELHRTDGVRTLVDQVTDEDQLVSLRQFNLVDELLQLIGHSMHIAHDDGAAHDSTPCSSVAL